MKFLHGPYPLHQHASKHYAQNNIETLEHVNTNMAMHVTTLEERAKHQKKAETTRLHKANAERKRLLSNWRDLSVHFEDRLPMPFLRYMLDNTMIMDGHGVCSDGDKRGMLRCQLRRLE